MPTDCAKSDLEAEIAELQTQNAELQDQLDAIADIIGGDEGNEDEDDYDEDPYRD